jgi:S-formylglutathione hydrolase FrmB
MRAARLAGLHVEHRALPGGHDWHVWGPGLETALPGLASRLQLIP